MYAASVNQRKMTLQYTGIHDACSVVHLFSCVVPQMSYIKGSAVALHCCKAHSKINRKMGNSTPVKS